MLLGLSVVFGLVTSSFAAQLCLSTRKFTANSVQTYASLGSGSSTPEIQDNMSLMNYDADRKMIALATSSFHPETGAVTNYTLVQDYNKHMMYIHSAGYCQQVPMNAPFFDACLPANFTQTGSYTPAGGQGTVNIFAGNVQGARTYFHTTANGEPFAYISYGQDATGQYTMDSQIFANVRMGVLSDPHVFDNAECPDTGSPVGK